jgi:ribonuclease J
MLDIHAGGHGKQEDIADLIKMVKPKYFVPIEGSYYNQFENKKIAVANGIPEKNVLMADNGQVIEFSNGQGYVTNYRIPIEYIFVDGSAIGDVNALVLRDRKQLAGDGMIVVVAQVSGRNGKVGKIDIISRGLTHMKEQGALIHDMVGVVHGALKNSDPKMKPQEKDLREQVRRDLEKYIFQKIQRQPMIIPVIIEA